MGVPPVAGEAAADFLEVSPIPANRRTTPSAWEDGTPLRARTASAEWSLAQVATAPQDLDASALLAQEPTAGPEQPTVAVDPANLPILMAPAQRLPLRTIGLLGAVLCGAAALACAVVAAGTLILPPLGALVAVAGLIRRSRAGAR